MHTSLLLPLGLALGADRPGSVAPERAYDIEAVHLELELLPATREVSGRVTYRARPLHDGPFILEQVDIDILAVRSPDASAPGFRTEPGHLILETGPEHLGEDGVLDVEIEFRARPWTGVHFRGDSPADSYPEVWTQGQLNDHHHWLPSWDHPNDRFDYTGEIHAPEGWRAVTNSGRDMPTYLIMFAAGPYEEVVHSTDPTTRVWVPPGTSAEAVAAVLDPVPAMKAHFAARTGQEYPWGDYLQVFVQRFLYFGMENTGATINAHRALVDARNTGTRPRIELLIAHELAHQWFGDLLTNRTWRDLWLHEGFATFMASDYAVHARESDALREAEWAESVHRWYDRSRDQSMPMARRHHHEPGRHSFNVYSRGAATLWMLRADLGEEHFWGGIQDYVAAHAHASVETVDLRRAFEARTGRDLSGFFQQWTEGLGSPSLSVTETRTDDALVIRVQQETADDRPLFHIPIEVMVQTSEGPVSQRRWMHRDSLELHIPIDGDPLWVSLDPHGAISAHWTHSQPAERLEAMATQAPPYARIQAIRELGETDADEALTAILRDAALPHPYRTAAARALGEQRSADPLLAALTDPDPTIRLAVAEAAGKAPAEGMAEALRDRVRVDPNPDVRAASLRSLAALDPTAAAALARPLTRLGGQENTWLVSAAMSVLGEHGRAGDLNRMLDPRLPFRNRLRGLEASVTLVKREADDRQREALGKQTARFAESLLTDDDLRSRQAAVRALYEVGDTDSLPHLERLKRAVRYDRERDAIEGAIGAITSRKIPDYLAGDEVLESRLEAMQKQLDAMQKQLDEWEERY